jgi:hypothetical protein
VDGVLQEGLIFPNGVYVDPPFEFNLNTAAADPETGNKDSSTETEDFIPVADFLNETNAYFRFRFLIFTEKVGMQGNYTDPRIDRVTVVRSQVR